VAGRPPWLPRGAHEPREQAARDVLTGLEHVDEAPGSSDEPEYLTAMRLP